LKKHGIKPSELIKKDIEFYEEKFPKQVAKMRFEFFEEKRMHLIAQLKEAYNKELFP